MGQKQSNPWHFLGEVYSRHDSIDKLLNKTPIPDMSLAWSTATTGGVLINLLSCFDSFEGIPEEWMRTFELAYEKGNALFISEIIEEYCKKIYFTREIPLRTAITTYRCRFYILLTDRQYSELTEILEDYFKTIKDQENESKRQVLADVIKKLGSN